MKHIALACILVALFLTSSQAQRGWEAGGWVGVSHYFGDLNTQFSLTDPGIAAGVGARFNFNERLSIKFGVNYGQVSASDADSKNLFEQARNLSFRSPILEANSQFEFNFLRYTHGSKDEYFTPYLFAGFTVFSFNPQAEYEGEWVELRPLGTEGQFRGEEYYTVQPALNYGMGMKISLSYRWSIDIELSARKLFTDYLDDVSTVYADKDDLETLRGDLAVALSDRSVIIPGVNEGDLSLPGRQRGNSVTKDAYAFLGVGVMYYFGSLRCPTYGSR